MRGLTVESIAQRLGTRPAWVSKWRQRFAKDRLAALSDAPRSGKPQEYTADTDRRVLDLLDQAVPEGYAQWNGALLAAALEGVSADQVWRVFAGTGFSYSAGGAGVSQRTRSSHTKRQLLWVYT
jgi:transposase